MEEQGKLIPNHVAIIADGNRRWAKQRGETSIDGHKAGAQRFKQLAPHIFKRGVTVLSVYIFSTENFKRSQDEVSGLMKLFIWFFNKEFSTFNKQNIKIVFSGSENGLTQDVLKAMRKIEENTRNNTAGMLNFCLGYGGRREIVDAALKLHEDLQLGNIKKSDVTEELFSKYLYQDLPPIDLLIRTSGEERTSGFMPYQSAYSELLFLQENFPDFTENLFDYCLEEYQKRDRRYGGNSKVRTKP